MAANTVIVKVNDKTKGLRFAETLTTGSIYGVTLDGATVASGSLALIAETPDGPKLVACAELSASSGTLSTNTAEMAATVGRMPIGAVCQLKAVLHRSGTGEAENVAVGSCTIVSAGGAWTDDTTGALVLYKGQKGDDGEPGPKGESAYDIAVRYGFEGTEAQWLASLNPKIVECYAVEDYSTGKFYNIGVGEVTLPDGTKRKTILLQQMASDEPGGLLTPVFAEQSAVDFGGTLLAKGGILLEHVGNGRHRGLFYSDPRLPSVSESPESDIHQSVTSSTGNDVWTKHVGELRFAQRADGSNATLLFARKWIGGVAKAASIEVKVLSDGSTEALLDSSPDVGSDSLRVASTAYVRAVMARAVRTGQVTLSANNTFATATFSAANENALIPNARYRCTFTYTVCGSVQGGQTIEIKTSGDGTNAPYAPAAHGDSGKLYRHVRFATANSSGELTLSVKTSDVTQVAWVMYDLALA